MPTLQSGMPCTLSKLTFDDIKIKRKTIYSFDRNPNLPLLIRKQRDGQFVYIPMELCQVLDDQRVKGRQQAPSQIQVTLKSNMREHNK
jgi:hypothetical protein